MVNAALDHFYLPYQIQIQVTLLPRAPNLPVEGKGFDTLPDTAALSALLKSRLPFVLVAAKLLWFKHICKSAGMGYFLALCSL